MLKAPPVGILTKKKYIAPTLVGAPGGVVGGVVLVGEDNGVRLGYLSCSTVSGCTLCFPVCDVEALWTEWVAC